MQDADTSDMLSSVAHTMAYSSQTLTPNRGDVIATGTPSGIGVTRNPPVQLRPGAVGEVELGLVRSTLVDSAGRA